MKLAKERTSLSHNQQAFRVSKILQKPPLSPPDRNGIKRLSSKLLAIQKKLNSSNEQTTEGSASENQYGGQENNRQNGNVNKRHEQETVNNLLKVLIAKGQKFKQIIVDKGQSFTSCILQSQSLKIKAQSILDKLIDQKRLNSDLKGLNNTIISQIQRGLINTLTIEMNIYQKNKEFEQAKSSLTQSLQSYKNELLQKIKALTSKQQ